jgi:anti-sigma B factor antagonist
MPARNKLLTGTALRPSQFGTRFDVSGSLSREVRMCAALTEEFALRDFDCAAEHVAGQAAVVTVRGELDMYTAPRLEKVLREVGAWRIGNRLVVDLTECGFMDSTALGVLIAARKRAGVPLNIAAHVGALRVLTVSDLQRGFSIHKTREEALSALRLEMDTEAASHAAGSGAELG